jgi:hypothetical protein
MNRRELRKFRHWSRIVRGKRVRRTLRRSAAKGNPFVSAAGPSRRDWELVFCAHVVRDLAPPVRFHALHGIGHRAFGACGAGDTHGSEVRRSDRHAYAQFRQVRRLRRGPKGHGGLHCRLRQRRFTAGDQLCAGCDFGRGFWTQRRAERDRSHHCPRTLSSQTRRPGLRCIAVGRCDPRRACDVERIAGASGTGATWLPGRGARHADARMRDALSAISEHRLLLIESG